MIVATSGHAVGGIDLSVNACPGNPGAIGDVASIDCASGNGIVILGTWAPAEDLPRLTNLDGVMYLYVAGGLDANGFWDFDPSGCNPTAMRTSNDPPTKGCDAPVAYLPPWANGATAVGPGRTGANTLALPFTCYRFSTLSVTVDQTLFGVQLIVDGSNAVEAGGVCQGCSSNVTLGWNDAIPGNATTVAAPTSLHYPTGHFPGFGNCIGIGASPNCGAVPTVKRTWGQLKSLYR
jgi:hypothetical protein